MVNMKERIKTALMFLKLGKFFNVAELKLSSEKKGIIEVTGWSNYISINNLTKKISLRELEEIKARFNEIVNYSTEFKKFIEDKEIVYNLAFNYGQGSIGICSEKKGILVWETELK